MQGARNPVWRDGLAWARRLYLCMFGVMLGVALVVSLTDDLGRRVCGSDAPAATVLFGCRR